MPQYRRKLIPIFLTRETDDLPNVSLYKGFIYVDKNTREMFLSDGTTWNPITGGGSGGGSGEANTTSNVGAGEGTLAALEIEVNELKALLRSLGLMA